MVGEVGVMCDLRCGGGFISCGAAPDERSLAVRAGDSLGWNLVDFVAYFRGSV